jgi:hypothetical protein
LRPYTFTPGSAPFHWLPFAGYLGGSMFVAVQAFGQKVFCYGGLIWILARAGFGSWKPAIPIALLVLGLEIAQMRLPGRVAEITDPLLVLLIAGLFHRLERLPAPPAGRTSGRRRQAGGRRAARVGR